MKVPFIFSSKYYLQPNSVFPGRINYKCVLYYTEKDLIKKMNFDDISPFLGEYAEVEKNNKHGLINKKGYLVLDTKYEDIGQYQNNLINVKLNGSWNYITLDKIKIFDNEFEKATHFENGIATVKTNGKYGAIDTCGNVIIPMKYEYLKYVGNDNSNKMIFMFSNQEDYFYYGAKKGLINQNLDTVLNCNYSDLYYFYDIAEVTLNDYGSSGVINTKTGEIIIPFNFDEVEYYTYGLSVLFFSDDSGKEYFGYINNRNKIIWSNNRSLLKEKLKKVANQVDG